MKMIISIISLTLAGMLFSAVPAMAEYSPWMKIRKIESYGKVLAKRKLVPTKIECKRGPGRAYWRNTLFRVKIVPNSKVRITGWKLIASRIYKNGNLSPKHYQKKYHSRSLVRQAKSGFSAECGILYNTRTRKNFSK